MDSATNTIGDESVEAAWRKLAYLLDHPSPAAQGVSTEALRRMTLSVEALSEIEQPALNPSARRVLRYLACLVPATVPDARLADIVTQVADHPQLPLEAVREILRGEGEGEGREVSATLLRAVADALRNGHTLNDAVTTVGVSLDVVKNVSVFLGVVDARAEALQDAATEFADSEDGSRYGAVREFARQHGIGETYAGRLIRDARRALEMPL